MTGKIRNLVALFGAMGGMMFATVASAGPVVTVTPMAQLVAPAPPVVVVQAPRRVWVPGYVHYDMYGNPVHVAGYWTTETVTTRRVVHSSPRYRTSRRTVVVRR